LCVLVAWREPERDPSLAERGEDGVRLVERRRRAGDEAEPAVPFEFPAAAGADVAGVAAVVEVAERLEDLRACLVREAEDRAEVFDDDEPLVAELAEQAGRSRLPAVPSSACLRGARPGLARR
jgi:hypothetical protein